MEETPTSTLSLRASEIVKNAMETLEYGHNAVSHERESSNHPDNEFKNIEWVTCKDFTIERGKRQIEEYIHTWGVHPSWLFCLEFMQETDLEVHKHYHYRAQWSIPTPSTPIPKETASVYFVIVISSKVKSQTSPAEVYFFVESNRLKHSPGKTRFRVKWLKDVIDSKVLLRNTVDI
uniref:Uncharacterized protein n=1 Tax=Esox lucius TaxID=8010 RepID=A0AAY5K7I3_ESOLU